MIERSARRSGSARRTNHWREGHAAGTFNERKGGANMNARSRRVRRADIYVSTNEQENER